MSHRSPTSQSITETEYTNGAPARPLTGRAVRRPKPLVEHSYKLDLADLKRLPWNSFEDRYRNPSETVLVWDHRLQGRSAVAVSRFVNPTGSEGLLVLEQRMRNDRDASERQDFALVPTYPHFGGRRWWAICPDCGRRVRTLLRPRKARWFSCRECHGMSYRVRQWHRGRFWEDGLRPLELLDRIDRDLRSRSLRRQVRAMWQLDPAFMARLTEGLGRGQAS